MDTACSSQFEDQASKEFRFEVPIIHHNMISNLGINNNVNVKTSQNVINSDPIVIEETDDIDDDDDISIVIEDDEKVNTLKDADLEINDLETEINNEILSKNHTNNNIDTTIDLDKEPDVIDLNENRTDSDVIILDGNKNDSENSIILDEINEFIPNNIKHDIIDVEATDCDVVDTSQSIEQVIFKELVKQCLSMNSPGMAQVINKTLLVIYKDVKDSYKRSDRFKRVVANTIANLDADPEHKFSHIKNLCDSLKLHRYKKKVPFTTLDKRKRTGWSKIPNKRLKYDTIDLDNEPQPKTVNHTVNTFGKVYPPIDLASTDEDDDAVPINRRITETLHSSKKTRKAKKSKKTKRKFSTQEKCDLYYYDPQMLLKPTKSVGVVTDELKQAMIEPIEKEIAKLKLQLQEMEEAEVLEDNYFSPYLVSEVIKENIVKLYKKLCEITGTEATKRHEVRLQVISGHPEGPVRCLEEFLNENIDADGNTPFPDMSDVTQCVIKANYRYELGWNNAQIVSEARAIFTQFGQSMQKRRQKKEWKDLMSFVKEETVDPADNDPVLLARLEKNKRIAMKNERDLLNRYAQIEQNVNPDEPELRLRVHESEESDEDSTIEPDNANDGELQDSRTDTVDKAPYEVVSADVTGTDTADHLENLPEPTVIQVHAPVQVSGDINKIEDIVQNKAISKNNGTTVMQTHHGSSEKTMFNNGSNSLLEVGKFVNTFGHTKHSRKRVKSVNVQKPETKTTDSAKSNQTDFEKAAKIAEDILRFVQADMDKNGLETNYLKHNNTQRIPTVRLTPLNLKDVPINKHSATISDNNHLGSITQDSIQTATLTNTNERVTSMEVSDSVATNDLDTKVRIKQEPLDIPRMLEELGNGFTATIFDIEDPFLVIEISDSSESEDES